MNDGQLQTTEQVRKFLEGSETVGFRGLTAKEQYYKVTNEAEPKTHKD